MSDPQALQLPKQVSRQRIGDLVRWTFPQRDLGRLHWIGLAFIAADLVMITMLFTLFSGIVREAFQSPLALIIPAIFLVFLIPPLAMGFIIWKGHARIMLGEGKLIAEDRCGPFRIRRRCKVDQVKELTAAYTPDGRLIINGKPSDQFARLGKCGLLVGHMNRGKPIFILLGYPREWTIAIGETLAQQIGCPLRHEARDGAQPNTEA
jgi:hypothetical protein